MYHLIGLSCKVTNPEFFVFLICEAGADLHMWSHLMHNYNGKSVMLPEIWSSSDEELLFTDASGSIGFAVILGKD